MHLRACRKCRLEAIANLKAEFTRLVIAGDPESKAGAYREMVRVLESYAATEPTQLAPSMVC